MHSNNVASLQPLNTLTLAVPILEKVHISLHFKFSLKICKEINVNMTFSRFKF